MVQQKGSSKQKGNDSVIIRVSLPVELHRRIRVISVLTGKPMTQVVVGALKEWVDSQDIKALL
jgi:hypothetical protein